MCAILLREHDFPLVSYSGSADISMHSRLLAGLLSIARGPEKSATLSGTPQSGGTPRRENFNANSPQPRNGVATAQGKYTLRRQVQELEKELQRHEMEAMDLMAQTHRAEEELLDSRKGCPSVC